MTTDKNININSLIDFYKWVKEKNDLVEDINKRMPYGNKFRLFFRGENLNNNELIPSIYRRGRVINEHKIYNEAICQSPNSFLDCNTIFDKLVKMQHYGVPTRLMDITENPMVSLYFASDNFEKEVNGKVFCFYISEKAIQFPDEFNTSILSSIVINDCLSFYEGKIFDSFIEYINALKDFAKETNDHKKRFELYNAANEALKKNPFIKIILDRAQKECGFISPDFSIENLARISCVMPKLNNVRVMNQGSAFLLFGFLCDKSLCIPLSSYKKVFNIYLDMILNRIHSEEKAKAEKELIKSIPIDENILNKISNDDHDFSLTHFASDRKSSLSYEITKEKANLLMKILKNSFELPLNTHHQEHTHKLNCDIKNDMENYFLLDNIINFIWGKYPIIFYDEIEIPHESKYNLQKELANINIKTRSLFPELEPAAKQISQKYDHPQSLIIIKYKDDLLVYHIDKNIETELREGDIIVKPVFETANKFWGTFVLGSTIGITVKRINESGNVEEIDIKINCNDFHSNDNPLFAPFSDY